MSKSVKKSDNNTFGKTPLQSWIGIVAPFSAQEDQVKGMGWGWRYKVRIVGDHSDRDDIPDEELEYAYCLLPTTAGSGGGGKIRTVRITQGDMVYGVYGSSDSTGIRLILGVFPRTEAIQYGKFGKFDPMKGWYGNIKPSLITGENEVNSIDAPTPNTAPILNKKSLTDNKDYLQAIGISPYQPSSSQNLFPTPPRTPADQFWNGGSITRGQLNYIRQQGGSEEYTGWNAQAYGTIVDDPSPENIKWRHIRDAESQAILQGIITEDERTREYE